MGGGARLAAAAPATAPGAAAWRWTGRKRKGAPGTRRPGGLLLELQLNFSDGADGAAVDLIAGGGVRLSYSAARQSLTISGEAVHPSPIAVPLALGAGCGTTTLPGARPLLLLPALTLLPAA